MSRTGRQHLSDTQETPIDVTPKIPEPFENFHLALLKASGVDVIRSAQSPVRSFIVLKEANDLDSFDENLSSSPLRFVRSDGREVGRSLYLKVDLMDVLLSLLTQKSRISPAS